MLNLFAYTHFRIHHSSLLRLTNDMPKNLKRVKSHNPGGKRDNVAKDALKKKRKTGNVRASKFSNAELKASLDSQIHFLYKVRAFPSSCLCMKLNVFQISEPLSSTEGISPELNVSDLTIDLGNL